MSGNITNQPPISGDLRPGIDRGITPGDRLRWRILQHLYANKGSMALKDLLDLVNNDRALLVIESNPRWFTIGKTGFVRLAWVSGSAANSGRKNQSRRGVAA